MLDDYPMIGARNRFAFNFYYFLFLFLFWSGWTRPRDGLGRDWIPEANGFLLEWPPLSRVVASLPLKAGAWGQAQALLEMAQLQEPAPGSLRSSSLRPLECNLGTIWNSIHEGFAVPLQFIQRKWPHSRGTSMESRWGSLRKPVTAHSEQKQTALRRRFQFHHFGQLEATIGSKHLRLMPMGQHLVHRFRA